MKSAVEDKSAEGAEGLETEALIETKRAVIGFRDGQGNPLIACPDKVVERRFQQRCPQAASLQRPRDSDLRYVSCIGTDGSHSQNAGEFACYAMNGDFGDLLQKLSTTLVMEDVIEQACCPCQ